MPPATLSLKAIDIRPETSTWSRWRIHRGLVQRIVEALDLNDADTTAVETPCTGFLPLDEHGDDAHENFSYRSIVGQLNYLEGHSRCDIGMATSQVARYVHRPKRSNELALIQICRYLKGTLNKGLSLKPANKRFFQNGYLCRRCFRLWLGHRNWDES